VTKFSDSIVATRACALEMILLRIANDTPENVPHFLSHALSIFTQTLAKGGGGSS